MFPNLSEVRLSDVFDVVIVATLIWVSIAWLQNTRARLSLLGIAILGAFYFLAQQFEFQLTTWLLQGFFAVVVLSKKNWLFTRRFLSKCWCGKADQRE